MLLFTRRAAAPSGCVSESKRYRSIRGKRARSPAFGCTMRRSDLDSELGDGRVVDRPHEMCVLAAKRAAEHDEPAFVFGKRSQGEVEVGRSCNRAVLVVRSSFGDKQRRAVSGVRRPEQVEQVSRPIRGCSPATTAG